MRISENVEENKRVRLLNNRTKKIQEESASDLSYCLKKEHPDIQDVTEWMNNSVMGIVFTSLHPKLAKILKESKDIDEYKNNLGHTISSILSNLDIMLGYIGDVEAGKPTGDIEHYIKLIKQGLEKIKKEKNKDPIYQDFVLIESIHLQNAESNAKRIIGKKKRDKSGIYK